MTISDPKEKQPSALLQKTPTGILGLDEITLGGLPKGRPTLICGSAGCGKTGSSKKVGETSLND